jgi:hypothetical protein
MKGRFNLALWGLGFGEFCDLPRTPATNLNIKAPLAEILGLPMAKDSGLNL